MASDHYRSIGISAASSGRCWTETTKLLGVIIYDPAKRKEIRFLPRWRLEYSIAFQRRSLHSCLDERAWKITASVAGGRCLWWQVLSRNPQDNSLLRLLSCCKWLWNVSVVRKSNTTEWLAGVECFRNLRTGSVGMFVSVWFLTTGWNSMPPKRQKREKMR